MFSLLIEFPNFNIYSTPLLVLVLQGLIFAFLLLHKYRKEKSISYLLLAVILFIVCYHRTTYTIGFMDWYDTFRNTKINYYLISLSLFFVPFIYFYVRSITISDFRFKRKDILHFIPGVVYVFIKLFILIYDASLPGFASTQNGYLVENFQWKYLDPFVTAFTYIQEVVYLVLTFQLYYAYRKNIQQYFSNAYDLELNWIRNFLFIYTALFVYGLLQTIVDVAITDLSWTQRWWLQFLNALAIIYIGVKGYFTNTDKLLGLSFDGSLNFNTSRSQLVQDDNSPQMREKVESVTSFMEAEKPYLDAEINLITLSRKLNLSRAELSEIINSGLGKNFNDFVNGYRVEAVKQMLAEGKQEQLSLLGIALNCGFNSKATFNRVFKKLTHLSPSEYARTHS
ncbi:AraC family transcriptional regulator [Dokdonia sinensis]|uniref:AraC family transcriptional regulator n=1 Tax=Dokdonia sinensis TaxID=2479847 RepID=A0A3M0G876_9FLAO|nr:AraC family transcriptional regulator [Dokdonia sinensis]